jgi:hypothetical protein
MAIPLRLDIISIIGKSSVAQYLSFTSTFIMLPDLDIVGFRGSGARSLLNRATRQRHDDCVTTTQESYRRPGATLILPGGPESRLPPTNIWQDARPATTVHGAGGSHPFSSL